MEVPTHPSFVGGGDKILLVEMLVGHDDNALSTAFPVQRRDALRASFERSRRPCGNQGAPESSEHPW